MKYGKFGILLRINGCFNACDEDGPVEVSVVNLAMRQRNSQEH